MDLGRQDLARRAFEGVADMKRAASIEALDDVAGSAFDDLGLPSFALARFFDADLAPNVQVLAGRFEAGWATRYVERGYAGQDRVAGELLLESRPYAWDEAMRRRRSSEAQVRIREEARDFGLAEGLFAPVRQSDGGYAAVVLAGPRPELDDPFGRTSAEVLSAYYAVEARRLLAADAPDRPRLSPRQRECLAWVRLGKSSSVIADLLGLSTETVEEHIAGACRKLGVRTRVQAVVEATLAGLIDG